jgi:hypothetical protein
MPILYRDFCGAGKQLNQIIFAGAHDAGITGGRHNVKTQHAGIRLQANAGVRLFDVRVTDTPAGLATYHGNAKLDPSEKHKRGAYGETLFQVLHDARDFVENEGASEFIILKFDKCKNYRSIAQACIGILGNTVHFKGAGSLNKKTLQQLQGHVVTVFTSEGLTEIGANYTSADGIFGCKSLSKNEGHDDRYAGLQYYGKGGTEVAFMYSQNSKIKENRQNQKKLMRQGMNTTDQDVMGMMYWTSTGILESIKERDDKMWKKDPGSSTSLEGVWKKLLVESIGQRVGINQPGYSAGGILKVFMPNIVMIDFADETKGKIIREFNTISSTKLVKAFQDDYQREHLRVV